MFDLLFIVVVGVSTAFAALRGGLRELSTLLALAIAGGLTWIIAEPLLAATGLSGSFFGTIMVAAVLVAIFFVLAHIGLHLGLKRTPLEGRAKLIDRIGGGAFGLFRGLVLVGLGYLGYSYYLDEARQPEEVKTAISRPIAAGMAHWFETFAPEDAYIDSDPTVKDDANAAVDGYDRSDRNGLDEIMTTVTTTDPAIAATAPPAPAAADATAPDAADKTEDENLDDAIADILSSDAKSTDTEEDN